MSLAAILALAKFWHWWIAGAVLLIVEMAAPGAFFLWMGVAAGITGLVLLVLPSMGWEYQFLVFALFSVVSILVWRRYLKSRPITTDKPTLNRRGEQYVGRALTLAEPIVNGIGKVKLADTIWKIEGDDMPEGTKVTVTGVDGTVLMVEKAG
ncbi:MAG TPA: NfeD family protein [Alphaproteobacteria bacterium]|nr:NfeD family protein [Alphaproteobacteria bacterium]